MTEQPIDVLWELRRHGVSDEVYRAVARLIHAERDYLAAKAECNKSDFPQSAAERLRRVSEASRRRLAALRSIGVTA